MTQYIIIMFGILAGCHGPVPGVMITHDGDRYDISIRDCRGRWKVPVWDVSVRRFRIGTSVTDLQCRLSSDLHGGDDILEHWRYGAEVPGYRIAQCLPLESGSTYEIAIDSRPNALTGHFDIMDNGDVRMIDGTCKD